MIELRECPLVVDRLPNLLENDLPAGELLLVRAHLEDCESCAHALADLRGIAQAIVDDRSDDPWIEESLAGALAVLAPEQERVVETPHGKVAVSVLTLLALAVTLRFAVPMGFTTATLGTLSRVVVQQFEPITDHFHGLRFLNPAHGDER